MGVACSGWVVEKGMVTGQRVWSGLEDGELSKIILQLSSNTHLNI